MSKQITLEEVKKHKSNKSVWIVIHNDVYDVTNFLNEHPGGPDSLLEVAGDDGTQAFEDVGHSHDARDMMKKYKIGSLPLSEHAKFVESCSRPECESCSASSCPRIPRIQPTEKTWRTYDGSSSSRFNNVPTKSEYKAPSNARVERRVQAIVVPRESSNLKWALIALAGAIVIGVVLKKYMS